MSEEVLGAIKFQHTNLLSLVDILRDRVSVLTVAVKSARDELTKRESQERYLWERRS